MTTPEELVNVCTLHRAESAAQQLAAQLKAFEARNGNPGLFAEDLDKLQATTNKVVQVRDCLQAPLTLVQPDRLTGCCLLPGITL